MTHAKNKKIKLDKRVRYDEPDIDMGDDDSDDEFASQQTSAYNPYRANNANTNPSWQSRASTWINPGNSSIEQPLNGHKKANPGSIKDFKINQSRETQKVNDSEADNDAIWTNTEFSLTYSDIKSPDTSQQVTPLKNKFSFNPPKQTETTNKEEPDGTFDYNSYRPAGATLTEESKQSSSKVSYGGSSVTNLNLEAFKFTGSKRNNVSKRNNYEKKRFVENKHNSGSSNSSFDFF